MWIALGAIALVFGIVISNIMLLKHSASMSMKHLNQDPLEKARQRLDEREKAKEQESSEQNKD